MKNLFLICLMIFIGGCGYIQLKPGTQELATQLIALNVASEFAHQHPEMTDKSLEFCDALLQAEGNFDYLFDLAKKELIFKIGDDPTQQASLKLIFDSVVVEGDGNIDIPNAKKAIESFKAGLLIRK